jgi:hypothetical protein
MKDDTEKDRIGEETNDQLLIYRERTDPAIYPPM